MMKGLYRLSLSQKRVRAVQPGEEKAPGTAYISLSVPEGGLWGKYFQQGLLR